MTKLEKSIFERAERLAGNVGALLERAENLSKTGVPDSVQWRVDARALAVEAVTVRCYLDAALSEAKVEYAYPVATYRPDAVASPWPSSAAREDTWRSSGSSASLSSLGSR